MGFFDDAFNLINGGGQSQNFQSVDLTQQPFLDAVRGAGLNTFNSFGGSQQHSGIVNAQNLSQQGQGLLGQLGGNAGQQLTPFTQGGFADEQIQSLSDILNRNLSFNLNEIGSQFGQAGTTGSRTGVAAGQALGDTQLALAAGSADILQGNRALQQQAAGQQAGLQTQSALGGLTQLGGLFNLSQAGFNNAFSPVQNFSNIIGQPNTLSFGNSFNAGQGLSGNLTDAVNATGNLLGGIGAGGFG